MKTSLDKKRIVKSLGILAIGAVLTTGGLFLWQNQFDISLFSSAATNNIQAMIVLGERQDAQLSIHVSAVEKLINSQQTLPVETVNRAEEGAIISSLRDQAVLGYNDVTKPITNHVYFLVSFGKNITVNGITDKDSISEISSKTTKEVTTLIDLLSARPGVFPKGFTVFLATLLDPLDGISDVTSCKGAIPNNGKEYVNGVFEAVNNSIKTTGSIYPQYIKVVDVAKAFSGHGLTSTTPWFSDCLTLNIAGQAEMARLFVAAVEKE